MLPSLRRSLSCHVPRPGPFIHCVYIWNFIDSEAHWADVPCSRFLPLLLLLSAFIVHCIGTDADLVPIYHAHSRARKIRCDSTRPGMSSFALNPTHPIDLATVDHLSPSPLRSYPCSSASRLGTNKPHTSCCFRPPLLCLPLAC